MKAISLFSGVGGLDLAASIAGFDIVAHVEIDPFCRQVLEHHKHEYWKNAQTFADVRDFGKHSIETGNITLIAGGFPCFAAGTLVLTEDGYKPIETLTVGEKVLTHLGNWKQVTSVMMKHNAPLRSISSQGSPSILTTDEHPFYVKHMTHRFSVEARRQVRIWGEPEWVNADSLCPKNHFASQVLPNIGEADTHSIDFWRLVGRYLADGWRVQRKNRKNSGRVVICAAYHEADYLESLIHNAGYAASRVNERTVVKFHIVVNELYHFLKQFGHKAHGKTLPGFVFELPQDKAAALVDGYFSGDGSIESDMYRAVTTVSKQLAFSMALLVQRAFCVVASVRLCKTPNTKIIEGRTVNQRDFYQVRIPRSNRSAFVEGNYGWKLIRKNEPTGTIATVYNIEVDGDNSYIADGCIVHNCQPFSISGSRKGKDDSRNMWGEFKRVISEFKPRCVLLENVPAICNPFEVERIVPSSGANRFTRVRRRRYTRPAYALTVIKDMSEMGYVCQWGIVSAKDAGAAHLRERWWLVGYAECGRYDRPQGQSKPYSDILWNGTRGEFGGDTELHETVEGGEVLEYATGTGLQTPIEPGRRQNEAQDRAGVVNRPERSGAYVVNTSSAGCEEYNVIPFANQNGYLAGGCDAKRDSQQLFEPGMGRHAPGFPSWLDSYQRPALINELENCAQFPHEPPRTIAQKTPNHKHEIKAYGNSVFIGTAYQLFRAIKRELDCEAHAAKTVKE